MTKALFIACACACAAASLGAASPPPLANGTVSPCLNELLDIAVTAASDPGLFNESTRVNNPFNNRGVPPPFAALPRDAGDVQRVLRCAAREGLRVAVKAGGHGFGGYSTIGRDGAFVMAFSRMQGVEWLPTLPASSRSPSTSSSGGAEAPVLRVQPGVRLGQLYAATRGSGWVPAAGLCPSVGVAGYLQGGGTGPVARSYGLGSDSLVGADLALANGSSVMRASPELLFGLRGGGGGNLGVATSLDLRLHPAPAASTWSLLCFGPAQTRAVLVALAGMEADGMARAVNVDLIVAPGPAGQGGGACAWAIVLGSAAASNASLAPLLRLGPDPASSLVREYGELADLLGDYAERHGYAEFDASPYSSKNCLVADVAAPGFVAAMERALDTAPAACSLHLIQFGGAIGDVPANATGFPWRSASYLAYGGCGFGDNASYARAQGWLRDWLGSLLRGRFCLGAYVNFLDRDAAADFGEGGWQGAYYGGNLPSLQALKQRWAPAGGTPLRFAQEIGSTEPPSPARS